MLRILDILTTVWQTSFRKLDQFGLLPVMHTFPHRLTNTGYQHFIIFLCLFVMRSGVWPCFLSSLLLMRLTGSLDFFFNDLFRLQEQVDRTAVIGSLLKIQESELGHEGSSWKRDLGIGCTELLASDALSSVYKEYSPCTWIWAHAFQKQNEHKAHCIVVFLAHFPTFG